jgi:hypothetical protein
MTEPDPNAPPTATSYRDDPEFLPWLKQQPGFVDLFAQPDPGTPPAATQPVATGGGQTVAANQANDAMADVVSNVTQAIAKGAVQAAAEIAKSVAPAAAAAGSQTVPAKVSRFWGR